MNETKERNNNNNILSRPSKQHAFSRSDKDDNRQFKFYFLLLLSTWMRCFVVALLRICVMSVQRRSHRIELISDLSNCLYIYTSIYISHGIFIPNSNKNCLFFPFSFSSAGVGFMLRKIGARVTPTIELKKNSDDTYTLSTSSTFKNTDITFKLGEEFDEETLDGRKVKSVMTLDGNSLVQKQGGEKPSTITRVFTDKDMTATMTVGDVVCTRHYKAV